MNPNYKTDIEFEEFLKSIGGLENGYRIGEKPITNRGYFSVGNGWLGVTQRLIETLISLGWNKQITQVKQKFGGLCFYTNELPEGAIYFIIDADKESRTVCEICGEPGETVNKKGWYYTLCENHSVLNDVVEVDGEMYAPSLFSKIKNGDLYYDAFHHEIKKCNTDGFFNPWCVKVVKY
jgi:hypothetical protein